ncbi:hypothetical protein AGMMS50267_16090 [Spirochaetia bacterium]|nr:hypothetical protein AGMMS50267_16090 [Spirochaetia bacterium]
MNMNILKEARTFEFYLAAVTQKGLMLESVPTKFRTPEICLAGIKGAVIASDNDEGYWCVVGPTLKLIPKKLRTPEICLIAVSREGRTLEHVPEQLKTPEMCFAAVMSYYCSGALAFVPERLKPRNSVLPLLRIEVVNWSLCPRN